MWHNIKTQVYFFFNSNHTVTRGTMIKTFLFLFLPWMYGQPNFKTETIFFPIFLLFLFENKILYYPSSLDISLSNSINNHTYCCLTSNHHHPKTKPNLSVSPPKPKHNPQWPPQNSHILTSRQWPPSVKGKKREKRKCNKKPGGHGVLAWFSIEV